MHGAGHGLLFPMTPITASGPSLLDQDYPVTADQIASYRRDGYIALEDVITGPELQRLRDATAGAVETETDPEKLRGPYALLFIQRVNLWRRHPAIAEFVRCRRLGNLAARLTGKKMRLWHDHALFKKPREGVRTPWHQDTHYWPHEPKGDQLSIWIALNDVPPQKGCMSFIPGSHQVKDLPPIALSNPQDIFDLAPQFKGVKPRICPLKAGSVTFHNGLTFHYAAPNKSEEMREALAIIFMPDGTRYTGKGHVVTDPLVPLGLKVGDELAGEVFPVVSDLADLD